LVVGIVAFAVFRKANSAKSALSRVPLFLMSGGWLLYAGLLSLPVAFPKACQSLLGHSIWDDFHFPVDANGTHYSGTWVVVRWMEPLGTAFEVALFVAFFWAILNLAIGCARKANFAALSLCLLWFLASVSMWLVRGPF
jgi:hypothetical protein